MLGNGDFCHRAVAPEPARPKAPSHVRAAVWVTGRGLKAALRDVEIFKWKNYDTEKMPCQTLLLA